MNKQFVKDAFGWGFVWIIGYALGMILFAVVPVNPPGSSASAVPPFTESPR